MSFNNLEDLEKLENHGRDAILFREALLAFMWVISWVLIKSKMVCRFRGGVSSWDSGWIQTNQSELLKTSLTV